MGTRSRIRWQKVSRLALGAAGCLALFLGLPSLIRRPEPPPLEPDIGLASVAASVEPARRSRLPEPGHRRGARGAGRSRSEAAQLHKRVANGEQGGRSEAPRPAAIPPTVREPAPSSGASPSPAPAPVA